MERERLGLATVPLGWAGLGVADIQEIAREAEAAGFDAIFTTEVNNDAMAMAQLMGSATRRIKVGTWISLHLSKRMVGTMKEQWTRDELVDPPSAGRIDGLLRAAFHAFEERWCTAVLEPVAGVKASGDV